jgi:hypothetical protein
LPRSGYDGKEKGAFRKPKKEINLSLIKVYDETPNCYMVIIGYSKKMMRIHRVPNTGLKIKTGPKKEPAGFVSVIIDRFGLRFQALETDFPD